MSNVIRVALPGYNALTDTDLDHFALHSDSDNVLIKEFSRGSFQIVGNGTEVIQEITHGLGYIPFFLVFVLDTAAPHNANKWMLLTHNSGGASTPPYIAVADTQKLYVYNYLVATIQFKYYIFYDNLDNAGSPSITESSQVIKVGKQGVDVTTSTNPNDYIFHSDLNTFKIIAEGNNQVNYTVDGVYTFSHFASISNPASFLVFAKFPDGKTAILPGRGVIFSFDSAYNISETYIDTTKIGMYIQGTGAATIYFKFYIFETPLT